MRWRSTGEGQGGLPKAWDDVSYTTDVGTLDW